MSKLKTGRLSKADIKYIKDNQGNMSIEKIAEHLNRSPEVVSKQIRKNAGEKSKPRDITADQYELDITLLPHWSNIQKQFDTDEQNEFIYMWNQLINQFQRDVLPAEQMQILDLIKYEIMMNRLLSERTATSREIARLEQHIEDETQKPIEDRNTDLIIKFENLAGIHRSSLETGIKQYKDLAVQKEKLFSSLKATRDQRLKVLENSKENFPQWLQKLINDKELQKTAGERMAKMKLAMEKEKKRLAEYHTYEDGMVDRPFLTPETVSEEESDEY